MKRLSKTLFAAFAVGLLSFGVANKAQAVFITGDLSIGGEVTLDTNSLSNATRVNIFNNAFVTGGSVNLIALAPLFTPVTFTTPYIFNAPKIGLYTTATGVSFDLLSSSIVTQSASNLDVAGTGIIRAAGFDNTPANWIFSSNSAGGQTSATFGFTSNTAAVPDGGSAVALLGFALVGIEGLRRKLAAV